MRLRVRLPGRGGTLCSRKSPLRYPTRIRRPPSTGGGDGGGGGNAEGPRARTAAAAAMATKRAGGRGRRTQMDGSRLDKIAGIAGGWQSSAMARAAGEIKRASVVEERRDSEAAPSSRAWVARREFRVGARWRLRSTWLAIDIQAAGMSGGKN
jgi:hypothetical protein